MAPQPKPPTDPAAGNPPAAPPAPAPVEPGGPSEPDWARELKQLIGDLPGKLRATITDDDRRSLAEHVHDLFDKSGAFERPEKEPEPGDPGTEPDPPGKPAAEPEPGGDSLARRVFGRW